MEFKLSIQLVLAMFFVTLGYLEAGPIGIVTGFIAYAWSSVLINFGLIPFIGAFLWWFLTNELLKNLQHYVIMDDVIKKVTWIYGTQVTFFCILTSIATILIIYLILKLWKYRRKLLELKHKLTVSPLDNWSEAEIQVKANELSELRKNRKLVGSVIFFFGLGVANHDFTIELKESKVNPIRPHGVTVGLGIATLGINIIEPSFWKKFHFYVGLLTAYVAFYSLSILPKGLRFISSVLWAIGNYLMVYNWYLLIKDEVFSDKEIQDCLMEVYK